MTSAVLKRENTESYDNYGRRNEKNVTYLEVGVEPLCNGTRNETGRWVIVYISSTDVFAVSCAFLALTSWKFNVEDRNSIELDIDVKRILSSDLYLLKLSLYLFIYLLKTCL